ncbi:hypothetical protein T265_02351 [Opisthorchis viverrini]|uniref:DUF7083 domain-containing protein n=1 Tax=Opisthorchis viverrini TaxID=6198 RepID=A0A074ZVF1_OPIVI|nr:hypothetical protein T265_02351 [Opisthorchis viverrini]KER31443.1 hypothetical protein T265_02351 [Opisthorchis viverrini]
MGSPLHELARYLAGILKPLAGRLPTHIQDSYDFAKKVAGFQIEPDEVLASFDVSSMYTNVPKPDAVEVARRLLLADATLQERTQLSVDEIVEGIKMQLRRLRMEHTSVSGDEVEETATHFEEDLPKSLDSVAKNIAEFHYDPDVGLTFDSWFRRYEDIFNGKRKHKDGAWRMRILFRKLGTTEHTRYSDFILPKNTRDPSFDKTVLQLSVIFGGRSSLFNICYQCIRLAKKESEDYITYAGRVNLECEQFKLSTMTEDQFKCLISICGLQSHSDSDIRA